MHPTVLEYFDIVDEHDQPLGFTKARSIVHSELVDWHRVTGIYILNDQKQLLCQQRSMHKDVDPGMWQTHFGGHLKAGETYLENAVGELFEEIGLRVKPDQLELLGITKSERHKHHAAIYLYNWQGHEQLHFNDGEVAEVQWMTVDEYLTLQKSLHPDKNITVSELVLDYLGIQNTSSPTQPAS